MYILRKHNNKIYFVPSAVLNFSQKPPTVGRIWYGREKRLFTVGSWSATVSCQPQRIQDGGSQLDVLSFTKTHFNYFI